MTKFKIYLTLNSIILSMAFLSTAYASTALSLNDTANSTTSKSDKISKSEDFPGRKNYRNVPYISAIDLYKDKNDVLIIDTRSDYEYETLNIKGSINIPLSSLNFSERIKKLYTEQKKTLVFYCNGHSCMKSYKAVIKTRRVAKIKDSLAFDAGIFDWAKLYPNHSVLLGKTPIKATDLIPKEEFSRHLIKPVEFANKADKNCIVLDVRDPTQRQDKLFPGNQHTVSLNKSEQLKLNKYLNQSKREKKPLCIYDAVGKQVRWLQYHLKAKKINDYYFMEGGAEAYYDMS